MYGHKRNILTDKEKKLLDAINEHGYVKDAAQALGISPRSAYNILYRLRNKYALARVYINQLLAYRRKSPVLEKVLTKRVSIDKLEKEFGFT